MPAWPRFLFTDFADDDLDLYYELDDEGHVLRDINVRQSSGEPLTAASRDEWYAARDFGDLHAYRTKFGGVGEGEVGSALSDVFPWRAVSEVEFEELWSRARTACEERWRAGGREAYERSEWFGRWVPLNADRSKE